MAESASVVSVQVGTPEHAKMALSVEYIPMVAYNNMRDALESKLERQRELQGWSKDVYVDELKADIALLMRVVKAAKRMERYQGFETQTAELDEALSDSRVQELINFEGSGNERV